MDNFKIVGTVIDAGTDGRFGPGREAAFKAFVKSKGKAGKKLFSSLVERGFIEIDKPGKKAAPKPSGDGDDGLPTIPNTRGDGDSKDVETLSDETEEGASEEAETEEDKEPEYTPTGKYEFDHYGGGNCHIIDPEGKIIDQVRPTAAAETLVAELNEEL